MMLAIGERLNGTRKRVARALAERDEAYVLQEVQQQLDGGAMMIDINGGTTPEQEADNLRWLARVVGEHCEAPACIDSANGSLMSAAIEAWLQAKSGTVPEEFELRPGTPWLLLNSITADPARYEQVLPLVVKYHCAVVALCLGGGVPSSDVQERIDIGTELVERLLANNIEPQRIYVDPLILPLGADGGSGLAAREVIRVLKERFPGVRTVCGLSNISFGLPKRRLLNRTLLTMLVAAGLDAAVLDTTDRELMSSLHAAVALSGKDEHCADYISAYRNNRLTG
jgi:cobalamin-dependent methionine synthase I